MCLDFLKLNKKVAVKKSYNLILMLTKRLTLSSYFVLSSLKKFIEQDHNLYSIFNKTIVDSG